MMMPGLGGMDFDLGLPPDGMGFGGAGPRLMPEPMGNFGFEGFPMGPRPPNMRMMPGVGQPWGPWGPPSSNLSPPPGVGGGSGGSGPGKSVNNDYSQHFVDTGQRPQNFLRDSVLTDRFEDHPQLKELVTRKEALVKTHQTPPYYLKADLRTLPLNVETFGTKFDVILVDPPWEEYQRRAPGLLAETEVWTWQQIRDLEIERIADTPSFVFLWCGTAEGLEAGRHCLSKWGFRRCEDICWIKTNKDPSRKYLSASNQEPYSVLTHTKEHCLMGIRGTVRRNTDSHVIHANCDTDVIVSEEPELGSTRKPEELYQVIERFCLGRRRLELFGEDHNIREGWVTVGKSLTASNFNAQVYASNFRGPDGNVFVENPGSRLMIGAPNLLPYDKEIDALRPKSPEKSR